MKKMNNKGFSLVELIIVIAIMAILIGVLAPQYIKYVEKSRVSADEDAADALKNAAMTASTDEDYAYSLADSSTITFDANGVDASDSIMKDALDEFFAKWSSQKVKSKKYKSASYTVTISKVDDALKVTAGWSNE